ncbi:alpha/beta hydrolase [Halobacillus salinarum]|uniref:Alpha/beta hydrolase n=1 Tax=Halobacillus salinarum TaxID=2932257 RepID=A0ABY4EPT4_9BACI|nr:alpha/beta hydrolase [Halobacillus salinarum]UOQ46463.1 alpha/beta hydrolase [Halobacillus salinarum]
MRHIFREGSQKNNSPVLLLLHGTGGTERDLLPVAEIIDSSAAVLSVRGNILENGMPRFFKRIREGVFDEVDLVKQTGELQDFLDEAAQEYQFDRSNVTAVGYSNGANIAGSLLFRYENSLNKAVLFHPMVPQRGVNAVRQNGRQVFIGAGKNDPICPPRETEDLHQLLQKAGAEVTVYWEDHGHQLTESEIYAARNWYQSES